MTTSGGTRCRDARKIDLCSTHPCTRQTQGQRGLGGELEEA